MILIIGSYALEKLGGRSPTMDIDYIAPFSEGMAFLKSFKPEQIYPKEGGNKLIGVCDGGKFMVEFEVAWPDSNAEQLLNLAVDNSDLIFPTSWADGRNVAYAGSQILYALKMSHRYKKNSPHFLKTMQDIKFLRSTDAEISPVLSAWYKRRVKDTYAYKHPNLNVGKKDFFNPETVSYKYDHDTIHEAIKLMDKPAYNYFKPDEKEVYCSKEMFFDIPIQIRNNAVYEESAVLAIERALVPFPNKLTPEKAFAKALEKVCTSITSGWFREWAWENHDEVINMERDIRNNSRPFELLFEDGINSGIVKLFAA